MKLLGIGLFTVFYMFGHTGLVGAPQELSRQEKTGTYILDDKSSSI